MCGIIGLVNEAMWQPDQKKFIEQGLIVDTLRGGDSTGIFAVDKKGEVNMYKKVMAGWDFWQLGGAQRIINSLNSQDTRFVVAHNRAATQGGIHHHTAHPIHSGPLYLVHNGTIPKYQKDFDHDSTWITEQLSSRRGEKEILEFLSELDGAFALVWFDEEHKLLRIVRNKDRPLSLGKLKDNKGFIFASEGEMLSWLAKRNSIDVESITEIPSYSMLTFGMEKVEYSTSTFEKKIQVYVPPRHIPYRGYGYDEIDTVPKGAQFIATCMDKEPATRWVTSRKDHLTGWFFRAEGESAWTWFVPIIKNRRYVQGRQYWIMAEESRDIMNNHHTLLAKVMRKAEWQPPKGNTKQALVPIVPQGEIAFSILTSKHPEGSEIEIVVDNIARVADNKNLAFRGSLPELPEIIIRCINSQVSVVPGDLVIGKIVKWGRSKNNDLPYAIVRDIEPVDCANYSTCDGCKQEILKSNMLLHGGFNLCKKCDTTLEA